MKILFVSEVTVPLSTVRNDLIYLTEATHSGMHMFMINTDIH